jgi:hypothetical protein
MDGRVDARRGSVPVAVQADVESAFLQDFRGIDGGA